MCGPHKRRALKVNRKNYRRSREDAARPRTIAELGEDVGPGDPSTGISVPRGGPGAQPSDALLSVSGQAPLRVRTPGIRGWPAGTLRRPPTETRGHSQPRRENRKLGPQDTVPGTITLLDASGNPGVPAGGENVRIAVQLVETRPYSPRKPHREEQDASRAGDGAQAPPPTSPPSTDTAGLAKL